MSGLTNTEVRLVEQAVRQGHRRSEAEAVRAAVAHHGRHYRAARLLHPTESRGRP